MIMWSNHSMTDINMYIYTVSKQYKMINKSKFPYTRKAASIQTNLNHGCYYYLELRTRLLVLYRVSHFFLAFKNLLFHFKLRAEMLFFE